VKPPKRALLLLVSFLLGLIACSSAFGQTGTAFLMDLGNGKIVGIVTLTDGSTVLVTDATVFKIPPPSPPISSIVSAIVVYESGDQTQEQNQVQIQIRMDPQLSKKLLILDKDTTLPDNQPIPQLASALKLIGSKPLPQIVGFNGSGVAVASEAMPNTVQDVSQIVGRWMP